MRCIMLWNPFTMQTHCTGRQLLAVSGLPFAKMAGFAISQLDVFSNSACMPMDLLSCAGVHTGNGRMCLANGAGRRQQGRTAPTTLVHGVLLPLLCEGQSGPQRVAQHAQGCCQARGFRTCCSLTNYRLRHDCSMCQCHMFCTASCHPFRNSLLNDPEVLMPGVACFSHLEGCNVSGTCVHIVLLLDVSLFWLCSSA